MVTKLRTVVLWELICIGIFWNPGSVSAKEPAREVVAPWIANSISSEKSRLFDNQSPGWVQPVASSIADGESHGPRYAPWGNGRIPIQDPAHDPCLPVFDYPDTIFCSKRPNLLNRSIQEHWDTHNLINTDRPDYTDAPYTVGTGVTVIESGYTFRTNHSEGVDVTQSRLPEMLIRYGVTDNLELRFRWNGYLVNNFHDAGLNATGTMVGGDDFIFGIKYEILQQEDFLPMVTFLGGTTIPMGTNGQSTNQLQPHVNMVLGWGVRRWLYFKYSTGIDWVKSNDQFLQPNFGGPPGTFMIAKSPNNSNVYHNSAAFIFQVGKRTSGFVEWFAFESTGAADNRSAHYSDVGLYLYLTTDIQLDFRYGIRLSDRVDESFTGMGFSVRF